VTVVGWPRALPGLLLCLAVAALGSLCGGCDGCERSEPSALAAPLPLPAALQAEGYVGGAVCAACHAELSAEYAASPHARSSWGPADIPARAAELELPAQVDHAPSGLRYAVRLGEQGRLEVQETVAALPPPLLEPVTHRAALTVGSGRLTFTSLWARPLDLPGGAAVQLRQLPVTRFRAASRWDMSPGYDRPDHQRFDRGVTERCFFCHNGVAAPVPGVEYAFRTPLPHGIGCERCHGPGRAHVLLHEGAGPSPERPDPVVNPTDLSPGPRADVCNACHLEGRARVLRQGVASIYAFRPGQALGDSIWVFAEAEPSPELFTHSSHGERLALSACVKGSPAGALDCGRCHPAHSASPREPTPYNTVCLGCHTPQACTRPLKRRADHKGPKDPCTDCHMVWSGSSDIPHVSTIDHWIRRPRPSAEVVVGGQLADPTAVGAKPHHRGARRLVPLVGPSERPASPAERLAAEAEAYLEYGHGTGDPELAGRARRAAKAAVDLEPGQVRRWRLLARAAGRQGDRRGACEAWLHVVALQRDDVAAWLEVAACRGASGQRAGARAALEEALRAAPDNPEALNRIGFMALQAGRLEEAAGRYQAALRADPELAATHHNLAALRLLQGDIDQAERSWRRAVGLDSRQARAVEGLLEVLLRQGRALDAVPFARHLGELLPRDRLAWERVRRVAEAAGDAALLGAALRRLVELERAVAAPPGARPPGQTD